VLAGLHVDQHLHQILLADPVSNDLKMVEFSYINVLSGRINPQTNYWKNCAKSKQCAEFFALWLQFLKLWKKLSLKLFYQISLYNVSKIQDGLYVTKTWYQKVKNSIICSTLWGQHWIWSEEWKINQTDAHVFAFLVDPIIQKAPKIRVNQGLERLGCGHSLSN
jgi:hypothetical protein